MEGFAPYRFQVPNNNSNWVVNLPAGGPYLTSMVDADGSVGGVSVAVHRTGDIVSSERR